MNDYAIAFYVGLFGSIHCVGMCGPLAFTVPARKGGRWLLLWDKFIYQLGRVVSYTILGLLIGLLGKQLWLLGLQNALSILSGALIILAALARWLKWSFFHQQKPNKILVAVNSLLVKALQKQWGHFAVGILNGSLPCGFVYLALVGAVNMPNVSSAAFFMTFFGLGTLPLMLLVAVSSGFISMPLRRRLNRVVPYFMLCLGVWFILRGIGLDIPYLSPLINANNSTICH